jgi:putative FmdB family regulatory protein
MPLFEFMCDKCGEIFETLVLGSETVECPKCKNKNVIKQFSSFAAMSSSSGCSSADSCPTIAKHKHKCYGGCCH